MNAETHEAVRRFLAGQSTMTLATVGADGRPQAAAVFFVADDDLTLYWLSTPGTRHGANVAERRDAAAAVYPAVWAWEEIRGVQAEGVVAPVTAPAERERALALYRAKFALPAAFDGLIAAATVYALQPRWVRWLDNSQGFGHKEEATLP